MTKNITLKQAWSGEADCIHCPLRASVLFSGLQQADFALIHEPIAQLTLAPGTALYRAGDPGLLMFTVRSGLIKQQRLLADGTQRVVRLAQATDVLGLETQVVATYQHDAIAIRTTELCSSPAKLIQRVGQDNQALRSELSRRWQMALQEADTWIVEFATGSSKARVARLLLRLSSRNTQAMCELVGREDMGAILGITTETASRIIAEFKRHNLIQETKLNQCYLDIAKLQQIAMD